MDAVGFVDVARFFVRTAAGDFVERQAEIPHTEVEALLRFSPKKKLCVEYCLETLRAKKVVRLRMKYASKDVAGNAVRIQEAYFMVNAGAPQFGGMGCGTFFSDTLEVNEIEPPPQFLTQLLQATIQGMMPGTPLGGSVFGRIQA